MPDRYWCTSCDVGYTSVMPGDCPHCGSKLQDMEGFEDVETDTLQEDPDEEIGEDLPADKGRRVLEDEMQQTRLDKAA